MTTEISFDHLLCGGPAWKGSAGYLTLKGGHIEKVAQTDRQSSAWAAAQTVVMPALCNAHDHGRGLRTVAFGAGDDALEVWIAKLGLEPKVDPYLRAAVAFGRMALGGVGVLNHCHNSQDPDAMIDEARAVAKAAQDVGVRVAFAVPIMGHNPITYGDPGPFLAALPREIAETYRTRSFASFATQLDMAEEIFTLASDHFIPQYGPVGPQWVDDATLAEIALRAQSKVRRVHMHLLETKVQRDWGDALYPSGLVAHLDGLGLLSERLTVAHGVWLDAEDCTLLADRGVMVSVNTSSNLRLRSGIAPVGRFIDSGLRFGMGMDGMAFDDDEDALRELRMLWHLQRGFGVVDVLDKPRLWQAVVSDGRAAILGPDSGGTVTSGAPADLLALSMDRMSQDVIGDRVSPEDLILTRATKADVAGLWIAGRRIVEDGACRGIDLPTLEAELIAQARAAAGPVNWDEVTMIETAYRDYYTNGCHCGAKTGPQ